MSGYTITPDLGFPGQGMPRAVEKRLQRWKRPEVNSLQVIRFRHPSGVQPGVPYYGIPRAN